MADSEDMVSINDVPRGQLNGKSFETGQTDYAQIESSDHNTSLYLVVDLSGCISQQKDTGTSTEVVSSIPPAPEVSGHHMMTRHKAKSALISHLFLAASRVEIHKEPPTIKKALQSPHWFAIMQEEIDALHHNLTWVQVPKTTGLNIVGSKWVFKNKL